MAVTQLVLTGVPAFVGAVDGPTTVRFSINETNFDPNELIGVDLAKNPDAVSVAQWATGVDCDQQTEPGFTTIGPTFHGGKYVGLVYLAERLVAQNASKLTNWPLAPDEIYQWQAVLRSTNGGVSRFHGFKVRVLGASVGSLVHVAFIRVGDPGPDPVAPRVRWIDVADPAVCDPKANGFTTIDASSPPGTTGALFLERAFIMDGGGTDLPKVPRNLGW